MSRLVARGRADGGSVHAPRGDGSSRRDLAASCVGALTIGASGVFFVLARVDPATGAFFRCALALPFLALLARRESAAPALDPRTRRFVVAAGLVFAVDLVVWHQAIVDIGAGIGTALAQTQLVFVALISALFLGERTPRHALVGIPITLAGVVLVSGALEQAAYGDDPLAGAAFGVFAGLLYATFVVLLRAGQAVPGRAASTLLLSTSTAAATLGVLGGATGELAIALPLEALAWLACLAIASQVVAWMLISRSLPRLPAVTTSFVLTLQPLAAVVASAIVLGESPSDLQVAGVVALLASFALASRR